MIKNKFLGIWQLNEFYCTDDKNEKWWPMGKNAIGRIIYLENNQMAVHLLGFDTVDHARNSATVDKYISARMSGNYAGYFGSYKINEEQKQIVHTIIGHSTPTFIGQDFVRNYNIQDDILTLQGEDSGIVYTLIWQKI